MKNAMKQIYLLFVIICFTLIIVDFGIISNSFINNHLSFFQKYTDLSNNFENSHSDSFEDDFLNNDSNIKSKIFVNKFELLLSLKHNFKDNFNAFVWQPPKFS